MPARVPVTAVLVAHDGSRWLPTALSALASQTVAPARTLAVDTGSSDDSAAQLRSAFGTVLELPRATTYAAAVTAALASEPADTRWIWLLHDDTAPDPGTLSALLRAAAHEPDAAVLGPKAVDWYDPRILVEIGCTTDALGVRETGVEPGEADQGQRDGTRQVLAVGTAGALVRRDVWDALDGLDPELPLREDIDLGWRVTAAGHRVLVVPAARMRHARATTTGRRALVAGKPAEVDRRSGLRLLLAHLPVSRLVLLLPVLVLNAVLRALVLLVGRQPREAWGELVALAAAPRGLRGLRRARRGTRTAPYADVRPLLASGAARLRNRLAGLVERGGTARVPASEPDGEPAPPGAVALRRILHSPALLLLALLTAATLVACRDLLGRGALSGGRLLAAPEGAADLWQGYAATAEPQLAVVALLATVLLGHAGLAVDLLLLLSVPAAGAVAARASAAVVHSRLLQVWAGAAWALLPVATGAIATGALGAAAVHIALPAVLLLGHRVITTDPRESGWRHPWGLGLALTPVVALAPTLWPLALVLLVGASWLRVAASSAGQQPSARRAAGAASLSAAVPAVLLAAWSPSWLGLRSLVHGPGAAAPGLAEPALPAWELLLLQPGGPGTPALLLTLPLLVAALGGLLRTRRARVAAAGWAVALVGLTGALILARLTVDGRPAWPAVPLDVASAGMLVAALVGAEGLQGSLSRSRFGWRQLSAVLLVVAAAAVPLASAAQWLVRGADRPLERVDPQPLPAFAAAELAAAPGLRALLLRERPDRSVGYAVTGADGPRLGRTDDGADDVVAALLTSGDAAAAAEAGIAFVATRSPTLAAALDARPGLDREPADGILLWRVVPRPTPRPGPSDALGSWALVAQALAVAVVGVLAAPGLPPRHGLLRERRR